MRPFRATIKSVPAQAGGLPGVPDTHRTRPASPNSSGGKSTRLSDRTTKSSALQSSTDAVIFDAVVKPIPAALSRQRLQVRVSSSPPFQIKNLHEVLCFRLGTKRHKIGTGNRVCPGGAYVSCVFSRNKSATTASCALRFSAVTACV
jgi:hypothetical protein